MPEPGERLKYTAADLALLRGLRQRLVALRHGFNEPLSLGRAAALAKELDTTRPMVAWARAQLVYALRWDWTEEIHAMMTSERNGTGHGNGQRWRATETSFHAVCRAFQQLGITDPEALSGKADFQQVAERSGYAEPTVYTVRADLREGRPWPAGMAPQKQAGTDSTPGTTARPDEPTPAPAEPASAVETVAESLHQEDPRAELARARALIERLQAKGFEDARLMDRMDAERQAALEEADALRERLARESAPVIGVASEPPVSALSQKARLTALEIAGQPKLGTDLRDWAQTLRLAADLAERAAA